LHVIFSLTSLLPSFLDLFLHLAYVKGRFEQAAVLEVQQWLSFIIQVKRKALWHFATIFT
ncbi:hypothetical protein ACQP3F_31305, partial [Escherichia coli]